MRDCHGTAFGDLSFKQWRHRTGRAQNVAEANDRRAGRRPGADRSNHLLGHTLCCAHHIGGIDRLVRGDEHKRRGVVTGELCDDPCAADVGEHRLAGVGFHQRNVFERRSMQHDVRLHGVKKLGHSNLVTDVGEFSAPSGGASGFAQGHVDGVEIVF